MLAERLTPEQSYLIKDGVLKSFVGPTFQVCEVLYS